MLFVSCCSQLSQRQWLQLFVMYTRTPFKIMDDAIWPNTHKWYDNASILERSESHEIATVHAMSSGVEGEMVVLSGNERSIIVKEGSERLRGDARAVDPETDGLQVEVAEV